MRDPNHNQMYSTKTILTCFENGTPRVNISAHALRQNYVQEDTNERERKVRLYGILLQVHLNKLECRGKYFMRPIKKIIFSELLAFWKVCSFTVYALNTW